MLHPTVHVHNLNIIRTPNISTQLLPPSFAIWKKHDLAVLIYSECISVSPVPIYKFKMLPNVYSRIGQGICIPYLSDTYLNNKTHKILIQRSSTIAEENNKIYLTEISYDNHCIHLNNSSIKLPVLKLKHNCVVLQKEFIKLEEDLNMHYSFTMKPSQPIVFPSITQNILIERENARRMAEQAAEEFLRREIYTTPVATAPPSLSDMSLNKQFIPQHVINTYLQSVLDKKEECPISRVEMNHETICMTHCGHAMCYKDAIEWMKYKQMCPVCRVQCTEKQLQLYKE